jgi:hypothetical protein
MSTRKPVAVVVGGDKVRPSAAADAIGVHYETVRQLVARGVFTPYRPQGFGPSRPVWLYRDEVDAYAAAAKAGREPEDAVLKLRLRKGRLTTD